MDNNSFSHVFHRTADDPDLRSLVNSFKHVSRSAKIIRRWSPDISENERSIRKRQREDDYTYKMNQDNRPLLLVKSKHLLKEPSHIKNLNEIAERENGYHKITKQTNVIEDIPETILNIKPTIRKETVIHAPRSVSTHSLDHNKGRKGRSRRLNKNKSKKKEKVYLPDLYKIEGLEFLPEGFIELEPLLFHDEFTFLSEYDRRQFLEEQKRIKMLRMRQYDQRKHDKMRQVSIYVIDEYKNDFQLFLDYWFNQNQRRLNPGELNYIAGKLNTTFEKAFEMQETFLKKRKNLNVMSLKKAIDQGVELPKEKLDDLPSFLRPYFRRQTSDQYSHVKSKFMEVHQPKEVIIPHQTAKSPSMVSGTNGFNGKESPLKAQVSFSHDHPNRDKSKSKSLSKTQPVNILEAPAIGQIRKMLATGPIGNTAQAYDKTINLNNGANDHQFTQSLKIKDIEGSLTKSEKSSFLTTKSYLDPKKTIKPSGKIDELGLIFDELERQKRLQNTGFKKRITDKNCDIPIDPNFNLLNCKRALDDPIHLPKASKPSNGKPQNSFTKIVARQ